MKEIKTISPVALDWLHKILACHWSKHTFDEGVKTDHATNNMMELFNSQLGAATSISVLSYLNMLRDKL